MEISEGEFYSPKKFTEKKRLSTPRLSIVSFSPIGKLELNYLGYLYCLLLSTKVTAGVH